MLLGHRFNFVHKSYLWTQYEILVRNEVETQIIRNIKSDAVDLVIVEDCEDME